MTTTQTPDTDEPFAAQIGVTGDADPKKPTPAEEQPDSNDQQDDDADTERDDTDPMEEAEPLGPAPAMPWEP